MPTAVELIAHLLENGLKLDVVENPAAQRLFSSIDDQIGPAFHALDAAITPRAFAAAEHRYGHLFVELGAGAYELGAELQHDAGVLNVVNKRLDGASGDGGGAGRGGLVSDIFSGQGGGSGRGLTAADIWTGGGGGSGVPAAFGAFNLDLLNAGADLKALGADLAGVGRAGSPEALHRIEEVYHADLQHLARDFAHLSSDARSLAEVFRGANGWGDDLAHTLSGIVEQTAKIGVDFGAAADIFSGQGGGSGFQAMQDDFLGFDKSLQHLSTPLANMLVPAVHAVT